MRVAVLGSDLLFDEGHAGVEGLAQGSAEGGGSIENIRGLHAQHAVAVYLQETPRGCRRQAPPGRHAVKMQQAILQVDENLVDVLAQGGGETSSTLRMRWPMRFDLVRDALRRVLVSAPAQRKPRRRQGSSSRAEG